MDDSFPFAGDNFVLIGKVVKAHGLKGEVKINPFSGKPANINDYRRLTLVDRDGTLSPSLAIEKSRVAGRVVIVKLEGIDTRELAEEICSLGVLINRDELPTLDEDEFYYHELIGLVVQDLAGTVLGKVESIFSNGAQEIMEIRGQGKKLLIPIVNDIVIEHDAEKIIVAPPPGLLDINN